MHLEQSRKPFKPKCTLGKLCQDENYKQKSDDRYLSGNFISWLDLQTFSVLTRQLERTTYPAKDKIFTQFIDSCIDHQNEPDIKHIIKLALPSPSEKLTYTANKTTMIQINS
ncbi:MAG: hypothetical protein IPO65_20795 [Saprospiraceae bacterium]|nr:hypothetical protein [Saprospiraceae bacterium]